MVAEPSSLSGKVQKSSTIEISIATINKLHSIQESLQKILRKSHVSYDEVLKVMLATHPLDVVLLNLMLEDKLEETKE